MENAAVRVIEVLAVASWAVGLWICFVQSRRSVALGLYVGCALTWGYDWILSAPEIWNLSFPPGTIMMTTWFGRDEALWAPFSYAAFYGLTLFYCMKYRVRIEARLGVWQYVLAFPIGFALNLVVEGSMIEFFGSNHYGMPGSYLVYNLPWFHAITTGSTFALLIASGNVLLRVFDRIGWDDFDTSKPVAESDRAFARSAFWVGVIAPHAAFFAVVVEAFYLYSWFGPVR